MRSRVEYLRDILLSVDRISRYTKGLDAREFSQNEMVIDAVMRNLEIMGEAASKLPEETQRAYSSIPWAEMMVSGKYILEEYEEVDPMNVWDIILLLGHLRPYLLGAIENEEIDPDVN